MAGGRRSGDIGGDDSEKPIPDEENKSRGSIDHPGFSVSFEPVIAGPCLAAHYHCIAIASDKSPPDLSGCASFHGIDQSVAHCRGNLG